MRRFSYTILILFSLVVGAMCINHRFTDTYTHLYSKSIESKPMLLFFIYLGNKFSSNVSIL